VDLGVIGLTVTVVGDAVVIQIVRVTVGTVAVLVDAVAMRVLCSWVDEGIARIAVVRVERAVVIEVVQDVALAGAAKARQGNDYAQQTSIHHHLQTRRLAQRARNLNGGGGQI